jgi:hypothetical protein
MSLFCDVFWKLLDVSLLVVTVDWRRYLSLKVLYLVENTISLQKESFQLELSVFLLLTFSKKWYMSALKVWQNIYPKTHNLWFHSLCLLWNEHFSVYYESVCDIKQMQSSVVNVFVKSVFSVSIFSFCDLFWVWTVWKYLCQWKRLPMWWAFQWYQIHWKQMKPCRDMTKGRKVSKAQSVSAYYLDRVT